MATREKHMDYKASKTQQKILDMMEYGYQAIRNFPKSERFSLAQDIRSCMNRELRLVIEVEKAYIKKSTLKDLDTTNAELQAYVRLAFNMRFISAHQYQVWSDKLVELGKMIGGWLRSVSSPNA